MIKTIEIYLKTNTNPQQQRHFVALQITSAILSYPQRLVLF